MSEPNLGFPVDLPAGGTMHLLSEEEVALFESSLTRIREDYAMVKMNDLTLVGALLTQQIIMLRAQQRLAGLEPEFSEGGIPTGRFRRIDKVKQGDLSSAQSTITKAAEEIRNIEKALGIDKKTREAGGQHTVAEYVKSLKRAAHQYGVRITERIKAYEKVMMESRWKLRVLENGDDEDKQYHDLTEEKFCAWLRKELADIEEQDKEWAKTKGKVFAGKL